MVNLKMTFHDNQCCLTYSDNHKILIPPIKYFNHKILISQTNYLQQYTLHSIIHFLKKT